MFDKFENESDFSQTRELDNINSLIQHIEKANPLVDIIEADFDNIPELSDMDDLLAEAKKQGVRLLKRLDDISLIDEEHEKSSKEAREQEAAEEASNREVTRETQQQEAAEDNQQSHATEEIEQEEAEGTEVQTRDLDQRLDEIQATLRRLSSATEEVSALANRVENAVAAIVAIFFVLLLAACWYL
ncbi:uncharacterized protein BDZ99DRAFT_516741 [Mytilinidion resinicola]|uniref:Uncharacterized protein n=1 Tax=Mytilinidion resinicola TaxID=574789 RepID=A0A6A6Z068_9PEZI|nr:uncharacterized protein BDZ99DRAFT_516741 [Mytilinidion resinicola]KAF2814129.1 hypothetical protein BDZ99DRAFT_516741 [Mytilinidion resinicola]